MSKEEIIFDRVEKSTVDAYKIRLKADQSEQQTLQDLIVCLIEKKEPERDKKLRFENQSVASILCMVFGLDPLPLDFEVLDNLRSLENGKVKIRATLEEEIKQARELQSQAIANISTSKENKAEKKSDTPFSMNDYLEKFKDGTEGEKEDSEILTVKKVIEQLKAERRSLEKLNDQTISVHISSFAFFIFRKWISTCYACYRRDSALGRTDFGSIVRQSFALSSDFDR